MAAISQFERQTQKRAMMLLANCLPWSILAKAFQGELVPQNPEDEPAGVLLERVRAEKNAAVKNKKR